MFIYIYICRTWTTTYSPRVSCNPYVQCSNVRELNVMKTIAEIAIKKCMRGEKGSCTGEVTQSFCIHRDLEMGLIQFMYGLGLCILVCICSIYVYLCYCAFICEFMNMYLF